MTEKLCIHKYLTYCKTNPQPPGFADFLRGTIACFMFASKYGYKFYVESSHPVFKCLSHSEYLISDASNTSIIELLPPLSYYDIYSELNRLFMTGRSFTIMTNSFYNQQDGRLENWGKLTDSCKMFLKKLLTPSDSINERMTYVFNTVYKFVSTEHFKIIHLRCGDKLLHSGTTNEQIFTTFLNKIDKLINETPFKYILISDSSGIARKLKNARPRLYYWDNNKVHLGDLINATDDAILDTLTDFFILSKSNEIITNGSGFSTVVSQIFDIRYTHF